MSVIQSTRLQVASPYNFLNFSWYYFLACNSKYQRPSHNPILQWKQALELCGVNSAVVVTTIAQLHFINFTRIFTAPKMGFIISNTISSNMVRICKNYYQSLLCNVGIMILHDLVVVSSYCFKMDCFTPANWKQNFTSFFQQ